MKDIINMIIEKILAIFGFGISGIIDTPNGEVLAMFQANKIAWFGCRTFVSDNGNIMSFFYTKKTNEEAISKIMDRMIHRQRIAGNTGYIKDVEEVLNKIKAA